MLISGCVLELQCTFPKAMWGDFPDPGENKAKNSVGMVFEYWKLFESVWNVSGEVRQAGNGIFIDPWALDGEKYM